MAKKSELTLEELTARKIRRSNGWTIKLWRENGVTPKRAV